MHKNAPACTHTPNFKGWVRHVGAWVQCPDGGLQMTWGERGWPGVLGWGRATVEPFPPVRNLAPRESEHQGPKFRQYLGGGGKLEGFAPGKVVGVAFLS